MKFQRKRVKPIKTNPKIKNEILKAVLPNMKPIGFFVGLYGPSNTKFQLKMDEMTANAPIAIMNI